MHNATGVEFMNTFSLNLLPENAFCFLISHEEDVIKKVNYLITKTQSDWVNFINFE